MDKFEIAGYAFDPVLAEALTRKAVSIVLIVLVTWAIAKAANWSFAKLVDRVPLFQRAAGAEESIGSALGRIVALFIWLFGLVAVLQALNLNSVIAPVQALINSFVGLVPKILGAGMIFFVGGMIARIVRDIVQTTLATINFDRWVGLGGAQSITGNGAISKTVATIVFVLIAVPVGIAALDVLDIPSITEPAKAMLQMVLGAVPLVIGACLLLGMGLAIAHWVGELIVEVLPGLGFDRSLSAMGFVPDGSSAARFVAGIVKVAIMLFMGVAATRLLGFPELTRMVETILDQGAAVVFGSALIAAGIILGRALRGLAQSVTGEGFSPALVHWLTTGLFVFIGLKQMNIGGQIVDYAFGAIAVGAAVAFALAFGLGGRDAAARKLHDLIQ